MIRKLFFVLLLLVLSATALGEISMETIVESKGKMATNRYTFTDEIPPFIAEQLLLHGYQDVCCVSGLALERLVLQQPEGKEDIHRFSDSLLVIQKEDGYSLLGLRWSSSARQSWLNEYGSMGLSLDKGFHFSFQPAKLLTVAFALTAECEGIKRTWCMNTTDKNVWYIESCATPNGETVRWDEFNGGFELENEFYPACWWPQLERMKGFSEYPVTAQQAIQLASQSWGGIPKDKLVLINGNLREKPTGKARSFGKAQGYVLGEMLDQRSGVYEPWYQVQVGNTIGWVTGTYVVFSDEEDGKKFTERLREPKRAVIRESIPLRYSLDDHTPVMMLEAGMEVQVLMQTQDEWMHIVVPTARAIRCMDMNGAYGYVLLDEIELME